MVKRHVQRFLILEAISAAQLAFDVATGVWHICHSARERLDR